MMESKNLTSSNYFSTEANKSFWSVSQFKAFDNCEAAAMAELKGEHEREMTKALLIGSYVDAYFSHELDEFVGEFGDVVYTKKGELRAEYGHANEIIDRIESDSLMMEFLTKDETQVIRTGELFGVDWKIKIDVLHEDKIVDLKIVKDFGKVYRDGFGMRPWIEAWGYDIQGAVYQKIEQISSGRPEPLPFYIVAATKEKVPDIDIVQIPQHILDAALKVVENTIDHYDLVKMGEIEPVRCEVCDYCKATKAISEPRLYEIEEASD